MNEEMNNNYEKNNSGVKVLLIILIILVLCLIGLTCYKMFIYDNKIDDKKDNNVVENNSNGHNNSSKIPNNNINNNVVENKDSNQNKNDEEELDDKQIIEKINKFYNASKPSELINKLENLFYGKAISKIDKIYITIHYIFNEDMYTTMNEKNRPKDFDSIYDDYIEGGYIKIVSFDTFEKVYYDLFGEKVEYNYNEIHNAGTTPCINEFDEKNRVMYFNSGACSEGISDKTEYVKIKEYKKDKNNYYLYLYVGSYNNGEVDSNLKGYYKISSNKKIVVDKFEGNEDKFDVIKWTFNKKLNFEKSELLK